MSPHKGVILWCGFFGLSLMEPQKPRLSYQLPTIELPTWPWLLGGAPVFLLMLMFWAKNIHLHITFTVLVSSMWEPKHQGVIWWKGFKKSQNKNKDDISVRHMVVNDLQWWRWRVMKRRSERVIWLLTGMWKVNGFYRILIETHTRTQRHKSRVESITWQLFNLILHHKHPHC